MVTARAVPKLGDMDHSRAEGNPRDHARLPHGSALLPVFSISDRATIAYEVISRSPSEVDPIALAHEALDSAQQTSPAVLFVPCPEENLPDIGAFQPAELATRPSVVPSEVAWILPGDSSADEGSAGGDRAAELRAAGFLLALEAEGWPTVGHDRILAVRPDYLLLRTELVAGLRDSLTARAELAGLISFAARLDVRLIARGVDDQATAMTLVALGVQFGSGEHLSAPLVLDAAVAIPGDEVVGPTWFRQHEPRKLEAPERAALVPTRVADLPKHAVEAPADDT